MSRRLSDIEYVTFLHQVDFSRANLPPWGGVVQWGNQFILVYICPQDGGLCQRGEAMLTDISDRADLLANIPRSYDPLTQMWWYQVPASLMGSLYEAGKTTLQATQIIIQQAAETIGAAAGGLTKPLLENLTVPLIVLGVLGLVLLAPSRH